MKVALVAGQLSYSNPAIYALALIRGLVAHGHDVQVIAEGGPLLERLVVTAEEELSGPGSCEIFRVRSGFLSMRKLISFVREFEPDILHSMGGTGALTLATRVNRAIDAPFLHTVHSWLAEDRSESYPASVAHLVVVNQTLREHLVNERNIEKSRIRVIPYGVDSREGDATLRPEGEGRIRVVGTLGRLAEGRRHDEFIRAAAVVREQLDDVHFVVGGEGPDERRLRRLVKEMNLQDVLTFVQPKGSVEIFSVLDLAVVVADWGGVGLTLLEAMAHGCPVLATGGGEVFSLLTQEETCGVVPSGDRDALAAAIVDLLSDRERRETHAANAREHVRAHYPIDAHLVRIEELYESVLSPTSG